MTSLDRSGIASCPVRRTGPDGEQTVQYTDSAGRTSEVARSAPGGGSTILTADYTYYANGQVETITYGNGAVVEYEYDDAGRLSVIRHKESASGSTILEMEYTYNPRGLITQIDENGSEATVTFNYDKRGRLIEEKREGAHAYWLAYTYDVGDNRQTKVQFDPDSQSQAYGATILRTDYHYDTDDELVDCNGDGIPDTLAAECYQTRNNRLMAYDVFDAEDNLIERVDYRYENLGVAAGNPVEIVRRLPTDIWTPTMGITLQYDQKGELMFAATEWWWEGSCETKALVRIDEFRGDGRTRTMKRQRDVNGDPSVIVPNTTQWFDYSEDSAYSDYDASIGDQSPYDLTLTEKTKHVPGIGDYGVATTEASYQHGEQVGSLRAISDDSANVTGRVIYTAFGERVWSDGTVGTRHQYCGAWGYETENVYGDDWGVALPYTHVGHRWYDPATGRFLQRDPIGIDGGLNVYAYCANNPITQVDPDGLTIIVIHFQEGPGLGHTVAFSTQTGAYVSFGPWSFWGNTNYYPQDVAKYSKNKQIWWLIDGLNEEEFAKAANRYKTGWWDLLFRNCIHAVNRALFAAGAPCGPRFENPEKEREYLDRIGKRF